MLPYAVRRERQHRATRPRCGARPVNKDEWTVASWKKKRKIERRVARRVDEDPFSVGGYTAAEKLQRERSE